LFDACNVEESCGIPHKYSDLTKFTEYLQSQKINYRDLGIMLNTIPKIAREHLGLSVFCVDGFGNLTSVPYKRDLGKGVSAQESVKIINQAKEAQMADCLMKIEHLLSDTTKEKVVIHFLCPTTSSASDSVALFSLVQTAAGRALYLFSDNQPLNYYLFGRPFSSGLVTVLESLATRFCKGLPQDFKDITFPSKWPSIYTSYMEDAYETLSPIITGVKAITSLGIIGLSFYGYIRLLIYLNNANIHRNNHRYDW
nr:hypothetical protein [Candidatus Dependentiae bacterium]